MDKVGNVDGAFLSVWERNPSYLIAPNYVSVKKKKKHDADCICAVYLYVFIPFYSLHLLWIKKKVGRHFTTADKTTECNQVVVVRVKTLKDV